MTDFGKICSDLARIFKDKGIARITGVNPRSLSDLRCAVNNAPKDYDKADSLVALHKKAKEEKWI
jgi:hypothetical protein